MTSWTWGSCIGSEIGHGISNPFARRRLRPRAGKAEHKCDQIKRNECSGVALSNNGRSLMQSSETDRMPTRNLWIVNDDPLFAACDCCNAGFRSFHTQVEQAEKD